MIDYIKRADALKAMDCGCLHKGIVDALQSLILDVPAADVRPVRWIPVSERCPEKSGDYLVFDDCRNLYVNEWHCLLKKWQYDDSRITHWMPLPEAPKEE